MAGTRFTIGGGVGGRYRSRVPGTQVGVRLNLFGMEKLAAGINGEALAQVLMEAGQIAYEYALGEWPVQTGASRDSIELSVADVQARLARIVLQAGGEKLIADPRNKSHKDYAPFIEFNGTSTAPAGILLNSVTYNDGEIRAAIKEGMALLIEGLVA